jgi:hypothetical protein
MSRPLICSVRLGQTIAPGLLVALLATPAFAATDAVNASSVSPTLQVNVTVQKAIRLTLSQGASGTACAVTAASDYSMNFGTVDALGINSPGCGSKFNPTTPGVTPSAYYSDYQLTPVFANQSGTTASITAYVSSNFSSLSSVLAVVHANSAPANIGALTALSTASGSPTSIGTGLASGTPITRYIGVTVAPTNSGSSTVSGSDSATVTYTLTIP